MTKVWPHGDYPLIEVGVAELNRNPEHYFAKIEQSSFSPSNVVPGISFSPEDAAGPHLLLCGRPPLPRRPHYESLPVNAPRSVKNVYRADGPMRFDAPKGIDAYYEPNSFNGPVEQPSAKEPPLRISGDAERYNHRDGNDDYSQVKALFDILGAEQQVRLFENIAAAMQGVPPEIVNRQLAHFAKVDPAYAKGVSVALARTHLPANSGPVSAGHEAIAAK